MQKTLDAISKHMVEAYSNIGLVIGLYDVSN